jgi:hypothetical protein
MTERDQVSARLALLLREHHDLVERITNLSSDFQAACDAPLSVPDVEMAQMRDQLHYMMAYANVLCERIDTNRERLRRLSIR